MQSSVSQNALIEKLKGMLAAGKVGAKGGGKKKEGDGPDSADGGHDEDENDDEA